MDEYTLKNIIEKSLEDENFRDYQICFTGTSGATDGYLGDIKFIKVKCITQDGEQKDTDLAIKSKKDFDKQFDLYMQLFFSQEIAIYTKILPAFRKFETQNNTMNYFKAFVKCYKCFEQENILVLENLKTTGYRVHSSKMPLDGGHLRLVLEEFGKFHALSFALKNKKETEFTELIATLTKGHEMYSNETYSKMFILSFNSLLSILKDRNEIELHSHINKLISNNIVQTIVNLIKEKTCCKVVSHVDSWNNNFMFLYKNNAAVDVKFLDWQMANVRNSPVYDLSHFLYTCSSREDLENLEELLRIYYSSFSNHLNQLGVKPDEVFSFKMLKEHWRKFSVVGFLFVPYVLKQCFWNEEDIRDIEQTDVGEWLESADKIVIPDENYYTRLIGIVKHFFNYKLNE